MRNKEMRDYTERLLSMTREDLIMENLRWFSAAMDNLNSGDAGDDSQGNSNGRASIPPHVLQELYMNTWKSN